MKILLLENNLYVHISILKRLTAKGYKVDAFVDEKEALNAIDEGYTCFLLSFNPNTYQGMEILKKIRDYYPETPVIVMNTHETCEPRMLRDAYTYGCSDYIKRPFMMDELEIKIEKLCHIRKDIVRLNDKCYFDFKTNILHVGHTEKHLSRKESLLFNILYTHKNTLVSFEAIRAVAWEGEYTTLDSIRSLIRRLRVKLPYGCIETVVNSGYILRCDIPKNQANYVKTIHDTHHFISA